MENFVVRYSSVRVIRLGVTELYKSKIEDISAPNNIIKNMELPMPEISYHITNNS